MSSEIFSSKQEKVIGFIENTLIKLPKGWKKIQDIEVRDTVLSRPEDGMGEAIPKKVINTFCFQNKPVWNVGLGRVQQIGEILTSSDQIVTFDHPYCVYGYIKHEKLITHGDRDPVFFDVPIWKRVNELETGDLVKSYDNNFLVVLTTRPLYKTSQENIVWLPGGTNLEKHIHRLYTSKEWWRFTTDGEAYEINEDGELEQVWGIENNDEMIIDVIERPDISEYAEEYHYLPFKTTVYNFEVEDNYAYFVSYSSIAVKGLQN